MKNEREETGKSDRIPRARVAALAAAILAWSLSPVPREAWAGDGPGRREAQVSPAAGWVFFPRGSGRTAPQAQAGAGSSGSAHAPCVWITVEKTEAGRDARGAPIYRVRERDSCTGSERQYHSY